MKNAACFLIQSYLRLMDQCVCLIIKIRISPREDYGLGKIDLFLSD